MVKQILVLTDTSKEFTTGILGNAECVAAVPRIVTEVESKKYAKVIQTKDTHGKDYLNTQEGKRLPVVHGQPGTEGYEIHPDIAAAVAANYDEKDIIVIEKPTFGSIKLGEVLQELVTELSADGSEVEIVFVGFCTGICVINNVVIAKTFCPEQRVCVIAEACACVTPDTHNTALNAMATFQVDII